MGKQLPNRPSIEFFFFLSSCFPWTFIELFLCCPVSKSTPTGPEHPLMMPMDLRFVTPNNDDDLLLPVDYIITFHQSPVRYDSFLELMTTRTPSKWWNIPSSELLLLFVLFISCCAREEEEEALDDGLLTLCPLSLFITP